MIVKIENIYLYSGLTPTGGNDSASAILWLEQNNIQFTHLWYGDHRQHQSVFDAANNLNSGTVSDFPFVVYNEVEDDGTVTSQILIGLEAITTSNLVELYSLSSV